MINNGFETDMPRNRTTRLAHPLTADRGHSRARQENVVTRTVCESISSFTFRKYNHITDPRPATVARRAIAREDGCGDRNSSKLIPTDMAAKTNVPGPR